VACLIAAINTANANGQVNTIRLEPGTYTLRAPDNDTDGPNGLPSITSALTLIGAGAGNAIIEREATAPPFRLVHVAQTGLLKLEGLTVRGGQLSGNLLLGGAGLCNRGTAILSESVLTENVILVDAPGGGIASDGRLVIAGSTISHNRSPAAVGGGIASFAALTVVNSTIRGNDSGVGGGLFISSGTPITQNPLAIIIGSTIADNRSFDGAGGGVFSSSSAVAIINSTIAGNRAFQGGGGGLFVRRGGIIVNTTIADNAADGSADALDADNTLALYNTIVSTRAIFRPACLGQVTSLGNNLFTDFGCALALLPDDLTGDAGLGNFTDNGTPGHGFLPLLPGSPAINAGDDGACLPTDQLGRLRRGRHCDIGAIEGVGKAQRKRDRDDHDDHH
jgi:hypothetical protein